MSRKSWTAPPPEPRASPPVAGRAVALARKLAEATQEVAFLTDCADTLGRRDRLECRLLLQTLEGRASELALQIERTSREVVVSDRRWARLELSCGEIVEHLGFLAQIIRGRTNAASRRA